MNEKQWRADVLQLAHGAGWASYYTHYSPYSTPGWPDLALVKPPLVVLAELKTRRGRVRPAQEIAAGQLERCNRILYRLWRPEDEPEVLETLGLRQGRLL